MQSMTDSLAADLCTLQGFCEGLLSAREEKIRLSYWRRALRGGALDVVDRSAQAQVWRSTGVK
jgi:hypothetical protein